MRTWSPIRYETAAITQLVTMVLTAYLTNRYRAATLFGGDGPTHARNRERATKGRCDVCKTRFCNSKPLFRTSFVY